MCVSVSAENLEKCLKQMDCQLLQLERDLDTFSSPLQDDLFHTKMAISNMTHTHTHTHTHTETEPYLTLPVQG